MKSIMQDDKDICYICKGRATEEHHIFGGVANRKISDRYGLTVYLCSNCHRIGANAVHKSKVVQNTLHKKGQRAFEDKVGSREDFFRLFMKNYLYEEE